MKFSIRWRLVLSFIVAHHREKLCLTLVMILLILISGIWLFFHIGGDLVTTLFSDSIYVVAAWLGASCAFLTVYRVRCNPMYVSPRHQIAWLLIGLAMFSDGIGGAYVLILAWLGRDVPVPSFADLGYTLYYPFLFTGVLLLPTRADLARFRLQQILEVAITTLSLFGIDWYGLLGPAIDLQQWTSSSLLSIIVTLSYPFWDILLLFSVVFQLWRRREQAWIPFVLLCCGGLLANVWADTGYAYFVALGTYTPGMVSIDLFWPLASVLIGLAALFYSSSHIEHASTSPSFPIGDKHRHLIVISKQPYSRFIGWQTIITSVILLFIVFLLFASRAIQRTTRSYFLLMLISIIVLLWFILTVLSLESQERRRLEQAHYRWEVERLEKFDRLKDQFMMTISHELRTPMMAIQMYLDMLLHYHHILAPEQCNELLQKAQHNCADLVTLLNTVMDQSDHYLDLVSAHVECHYSRLQPILERVLELIEPQVVAEQREVRVSLPQGVMVQADSLYLRQVLCNLSINALKYSPKGTPIMISCDFNQDQLTIRVKDQGKGIAPQDQVYLFQRFVRLPYALASSTRGSGLGLYISRRLIEAMQGKIWVESSGIEGEGSTFVIQLPGGREGYVARN